MTQAFPLQWPDGWPRTPKHKRGPPKFQKTWAGTLSLVRDEVRRLGGGNMIISSNVPLRRDGSPYADMAQDRVDDPGVAVYFVLNGQPRVMARDVYLTVHDNLHSVALAIEAMRAIERHGGAATMERPFEGFAALPAPGATPWHDVLQVRRDASRDDVEAAFRRLARERHPDRGGSDAMMAELNRARTEGLEAVALSYPRL